jgi:DNA replication protein DnaC
MKSAVPSRRDRLRQMLADLRMPGALEALDAILQGVDGATLTAPEAIEQLLGAQIQLRNNRRLQAAMRSSRLPAIKRLTEFDFSFQPSLRREQMESLHELGFVERRENVVFLGPPGVGKTHLAISLAIAAAQHGRRVYYGTLADLITSLEEAQAAGRLQARLKVLTHPALLVVDEIGYLPISRTGAMLFFQLMTRRYEHVSTVLTSNKGFEEWGEIFGDEVMAAALIDRLVHHCHIVTIRGTATACDSTPICGTPCTRPKIPSRRPLAAGALVRRWRRTEARPLAELSDFHPAELSDFGPALTVLPFFLQRRWSESLDCCSILGGV